MSKQNQKQLGDAIREQGGLKKPSGNMNEIVYDKESGEFFVKEKGSTLNEGEEDVTEMTEKGFACMSPTRLAAEKRALGLYLPQNAFVFKEDEVEPYVLMAVKTNSGHLYTLRIDLGDFPNSIPDMMVTKMLLTKNGERMDNTSAKMHTLSAKHGYTRICHYGGNDWTPMVSIAKLYVRGRLWLEIYDGRHLKTGKPMDYYLKHAS